MSEADRSLPAREARIYDSLAVAPTAAAYGVGPAWIGGILYWSDGLSWDDVVGSGGSGSATTLDVASLGADTTGATDCASIINSALASLYAAGGGTLYFPIGVYRVDSAITIPGDSATPQKSVPISFVGEGARWVGRNVSPTGGSVLDLRATDTYGKIKSNSLHLLSFSGLTFTDGAGTSTPFIYTTNATLNIDACAFWGSKSSAWDQDAIILGGANQVEGGQGWDDGFQGYGTVIKDSYFAKLRRAIYGRAFCNAVNIINNTVWSSCGDNAGAAIEINGRPTTGSGVAAGNYIAGNLIELVGYKYGIMLNYASENVLIGNGFYDATGVTTASVRFEANANSNFVISAYDASSISDINGSDSSLPNRVLTQKQASIGKLGPVSFPDSNYPTTIRKPVMSGWDATAFTVQPGSSIADGSTLIKVLRSAAESTNPAAVIMSLVQSGTLTLRGSSAGQLIAQDAAGSELTRFDAGMRQWKAAGTGGPMLQDSGSGGSYLTLKNYGVKLQLQDGSNEVMIKQGSGTPEGAIAANVGSLYLRTNGGAGTTLYIKETGTGNTGWVAK
jgi:hypothetical protein